jgi:hypothetical protein
MKNLGFSFVFVILTLTSCVNENNINKIEWLDELDYFDGERAYYFVDVGGRSAYVGGVLEIYNMLDNSYIDRITVESFDLISRTDGYPLCRIWGSSGKLNKSTYLLARNCINSD